MVSKDHEINENIFIKRNGEKQKWQKHLIS
uniref:Uncharacterized protein n=1 Tax=Siphoviridae sp. ctnpt50 TaxID=2827941 RepID=A0A8S5SDF0_9CAUD|nr:MAG TPA: hypothetical protein [Siphoviridae sp. ctnpt50]